MSDSGDSHLSSTPLKLLPAYLGTDSIEVALATARGRRILWLEILVNDRLDPAPWLDNPAMQQAIQTACRWYSRYSRLITFLFDRAPLPPDPGPIDFREYRTFAEALHFAYHHPIRHSGFGSPLPQAFLYGFEERTQQVLHHPASACLDFDRDGHTG